MSTLDQIERIATEKATEFCKKLNGQYRHHVSDAFIIAYIKRQLYKEFQRDPKNTQSELAYHSCVYLFESLLEYGCRTGGNGHHVAQDFSSLFPHEPFPFKLPKS